MPNSIPHEHVYVGSLRLKAIPQFGAGCEIQYI